MALPEVQKTKNARYLISYKATQKSMRPACIQILFPHGTGAVERLGTNIGKKKKHWMVVHKYDQQKYFIKFHFSAYQLPGFFHGMAIYVVKNILKTFSPA